MKLKYMGAADSRVFEAGEDFQGRLATPLPRDIILSWSNRHVIDSEAEENADLPPELFELLKIEPGFSDVTDYSVVPLNDAERLWKGMRDPNDTRWSRPSYEVLEGSEVPMPRYNDKFPTRVTPPPDFQRPAGVVPNDDLIPATTAEPGEHIPDGVHKL